MYKHHLKPRPRLRIQKASGNYEPFSRRKLYQSLKRTGLKNSDCKKISTQIEKEVKEGSSTSDIFNKTLNLVNKTSYLSSANYSLKKALFDLGPEGHYFEDFVSRYFEELGLETKTCIVYQGKYVKHEVDVVSYLKGKAFFTECKFHNRAGIKNDVKISLYVKARWDDLKDGPEGKNLAGYYIASNTAFSLDAITYAKGTGLTLLGVNSPKEESFLETIRKLRLYPVTSLRSLNRTQKRELLRNKIILAKDLIYYKSKLTALGLCEKDFIKIENELLLLKVRDT